MSDGAVAAPRLAGALLFVPAQERRLAKLAELDADAFVLDLEDAIHPEAKAAARELAAAAIDDFDRRVPILVRINPLGAGGAEDLRALAASRPDALVVPKAAAADGLAALAATAAEFWAPAAVPPLVPLVESARGVLALEGMLAPGAMTPIAGVALGAEDFAADLGVARSSEGTEVALARQLIALNAHASGVAAIDTPFIDVGDEEGLAADVAAAAQLGFVAKLCIHPSQVGAVRAGLAPSAEQLDWARRVVRAAGEGADRGEAVAVLDGLMLDRPVLAQARRLLERGSPAQGAG